MTITAQTAKTGPYTGNGSTVTFSYDFKISDDADLTVTVLAVDGITSTVKTLNVDYTVTGAGNPNGGSIEMTVAPAAGELLTITRAVVLSQEIDLQNRKAVSPEVLETGFDKLTQIAQDHQEQLDRSLKVDLFEEADLAQLTLNVNALASIDDAISTVAGISASVVAAAANEADIDAVGANIADVVTAADNIAAIQAAPAEATAAAASAAAASTSEANAATSATNAAASETAAASSATAAASSATAAAASESAAASSASAASTSETNASNSATAAAASATAAAASETAAAASEAAAVASESAAATSETNASTSETNAAASASTASTAATTATTQATAAASSASAAATSETNAATSEANAAASYDLFDDRFLGAKSSAPALDNDGDALVAGALYFDTTVGAMYVWNGSAWQSTEYNSTSVDINGGSIDGTPIGANSASTGAFTTLGIGTTSPDEALEVVGDLHVGFGTDFGVLHLGDTVDQTKIIGRGSAHATLPDTLDFQNASGLAMRINNSRNLLVGTTTADPASSGNVAGCQFGTDGGHISRDGAAALTVNRKTNDGGLVTFRQDGTVEGSISVSGTTVSYNGGHLSRWSRLPDGSDDSNIFKGTVMTNLNEKIVWDDEDNEQLNYTNVSSVEGDKNVAGVFVAWDKSDDWGDYYLAMTGDMIIRIAAGTTVEQGDLLMSAGDGTAKPQEDDLVRSKTVAKVISTEISCTYADGSYCVPCVLMGC